MRTECLDCSGLSVMPGTVYAPSSSYASPRSLKTGKLGRAEQRPQLRYDLMIQMCCSQKRMLKPCARHELCAHSHLRCAQRKLAVQPVTWCALDTTNTDHA